MDRDKQRIAIRVHGKVHGVFFRASTQERAKALGINGFVQNEADGTVYLEAEGNAESLLKLEQWVHQGPTAARVDRVDVKTLDDLKDFDGFEQRM